MKLQLRGSDEPEVNLTPLIDVVLLLLVFFMVSTTFIREAELKVQLPEASVDPDVTDIPSLEVIVDADGVYYVNNRELVNNSVETLQRALAGIDINREEAAVTIRADARATHQSVVTVMDVAGKLGFVNITIITATPENGN
ncbi:MAG: biopolymer transporter ExbD [Gammaproteobacteria bacterium]|nr:biopolymer transporter ExbD [Gammaproteobacteria bacterium]